MFSTVTLSNGVRLVLETIPFVRSISCGIWVSNGSRNEDITTNGISHFIEHMLFKGTENRTARDIADEMDSIGGQINAFTSKEYTCYYTRTLENHFDIAIDILADMFFNSKFEESEIKKERGVIIEEINMYEDTPEDLVHDILQFNAFKDDSLGYPILGTQVGINTFTTKTFKNYFDANYHQDNTVIAIAGNFEAEDIVKKIESYFGKFKRKNNYVTPVFSTKFRKCLVQKEKEIEQVHICLGLPSIKLGSEQSYELALLNTIFGGGMSSRLFQKIREENGLSYSVYSYNSSYVDTGIFSIYAALNASQTNQVISLILGEIKRMFTEKISESELSRTKEQLKSNYLLSLESSSNRMNSIGRSTVLLNRILSPDELIEKINAVTLKGFYNLAEEMFDLDKLCFSAVGNIKGLDFQEMITNGKKVFNL